VAVLVGVAVRVLVGVEVEVAVAVLVGVLVGVAVRVLVGVAVAVLVGVAVGVLVGVLVGVAVAVLVGVAVAVLVGVAVAVLVGVAVAVLVGVTSIRMTSDPDRAASTVLPKPLTTCPLDPMTSNASAVAFVYEYTAASVDVRNDPISSSQYPSSSTETRAEMTDDVPLAPVAVA
jgi:hypothetical protein